MAYPRMMLCLIFLQFNGGSLRYLPATNYSHNATAESHSNHSSEDVASTPVPVISVNLTDEMNSTLEVSSPNSSQDVVSSPAPVITPAIVGYYTNEMDSTVAASGEEEDVSSGSVASYTDAMDFNTATSHSQNETSQDGDLPSATATDSAEEMDSVEETSGESSGQDVDSSSTPAIAVNVTMYSVDSTNGPTSVHENGEHASSPTGTDPVDSVVETGGESENQEVTPAPVLAFTGDMDSAAVVTGQNEIRRGGDVSQAAAIVSDVHTYEVDYIMEASREDSQGDVCHDETTSAPIISYTEQTDSVEMTDGQTDTNSYLASIAAPMVAYYTDRVDRLETSRENDSQEVSSTLDTTIDEIYFSINAAVGSVSQNADPNTVPVIDYTAEMELSVEASGENASEDFVSSSAPLTDSSAQVDSVATTIGDHRNAISVPTMDMSDSHSMDSAETPKDRKSTTTQPTESPTSSSMPEEGHSSPLSQDPKTEEDNKAQSGSGVSMVTVAIGH